MSRPFAAFAILTFLLIGSTAAAAAGPGRPTIGILYRFNNDDLDARIVRSLRDVGWAENRDVTIERRYWEGRADRLPALASELVGRRVDVIVAVGTPSTLAARKATTVIPIVMVFVSDPVRSGLVSSLAHPGGNITGASMQAPDASLKALQLLKEAIPPISRVGIVVDPSNASHPDIVRDLEASARLVALKLKSLELRRPADADALLAAALGDGIEALLILPARPADLPVEQSSRFELLINLRTAKALRLTRPPSLLLRADHVIE